MTYKLKLARGRSYIGNDLKMLGAGGNMVPLKATAKNPVIYTEDKATVDYLIECKRFELLGVVEPEEAEEAAAAADETKVPPGNQAPNNPPDDGPSEAWTVAQLTAYATENGIDLEGARAKADILAKIQEAENAIDFGDGDEN